MLPSENGPERKLTKRWSNLRKDLRQFDGAAERQLVELQASPPAAQVQDCALKNDVLQWMLANEGRPPCGTWKVDH